MTEPVNGTDEKPVPRHHLTRFSSTRQPAKYGRSRTFKDRLTHDFLRGLSDDFAKNGMATIEHVRETEPAQYLRICASLVPKEIDMRVEDGGDPQLLEQRLQLLDALLEARRAKTASAIDVEVTSVND
jgi:hypothetical protein